MKGIYDRLKAYGKSDFYPFHMPGHKRNSKCGPLSELYRLQNNQEMSEEQQTYAASVFEAVKEGEE